MHQRKENEVMFRTVTFCRKHINQDYRFLYLHLLSRINSGSFLLVRPHEKLWLGLLGSGLGLALGLTLTLALIIFRGGGLTGKNQNSFNK